MSVIKYPVHIDLNGNLVDDSGDVIAIPAKPGALAEIFAKLEPSLKKNWSK